MCGPKGRHRQGLAVLLWRFPAPPAAWALRPAPWGGGGGVQEVWLRMWVPVSEQVCSQRLGWGTVGEQLTALGGTREATTAVTQLQGSTPDAPSLQTGSHRQRVCKGNPRVRPLPAPVFLCGALLSG